MVPKVYFCLFCVKKLVNENDLTKHIIDKHFDGNVDNKTDEWILSFGQYVSRVNHSLNQEPQELPQSSVECLSQKLLIGCLLCDRIVHHFKLGLHNDYPNHKRKDKCVCGGGIEVNKVVIKCHLCQQLLHYDCVEPSNFSGEDTSLYKCYKCKPKEYKIEKLKDFHQSLQRLHLYHHFSYLPILCKAVKTVNGRQQVCNESFPLKNFLKAHIKADHNINPSDQVLEEIYLKNNQIPKLQDLIDNCLQLTNGNPCVQSVDTSKFNETNYHKNITPNNKSNGLEAPILTAVQLNPTLPSGSSISHSSRLNMNQVFNKIQNKKKVTNNGINHRNSCSSGQSNVLDTPPVLVSESSVPRQQTIPVKRPRGRPPKSQSKAGNNCTPRNVSVKPHITPNSDYADRNPMPRNRLSAQSRASRPNIRLSREQEKALKEKQKRNFNEESDSWDSDVERFERPKRVRTSNKISPVNNAFNNVVNNAVNNAVNNVVNNAVNNVVNNVSNRQTNDLNNKRSPNLQTTGRPRSQTPLESNTTESSANSPLKTLPTRPRLSTQITRILDTESDQNHNNQNGMSSQVNGMNNIQTSDPEVRHFHHISRSDWLLRKKPAKYPYFPQLGDEVVYIPLGHRSYIDAVRVNQHYIQTNTNKFVNTNDCIFAKVKEIKFEKHKDITVSKLTLICLDNTNNETKQQFTVKFHDIDNVIDFIILKQMYDNSIKIEWKVGDQFRAIVEDKYWFGTIANFVLNANNEMSYFQSIGVKWANDSHELLSFWDLEKIRGKMPLNRRNSVEVTDEDRHLFYRSNVKEWPVRGMAYECNRISNGLREIMALPECQQMSKMINSSKHDYVKNTAYPITIDIIKSRVDNHFYRRQAAIKCDIKYIFTNACSLNTDKNHNLVKHALVVTYVCLLFIDNPNAINIKLFYDRALVEPINNETVRSYSCHMNSMNNSQNERNNPSNVVIDHKQTINHTNDEEIILLSSDEEEEEEEEEEEVDHNKRSSPLNSRQIKQEKIDERERSMSSSSVLRRLPNANNFTPTQSNQVSRPYFCVLSKELNTFADRNEAIDHYCNKLKVKLKCSLCPQNLKFESLEQFIGHNRDHINSMQPSFDQKSYVDHINWIKQMVTYSEMLTNEMTIYREINTLYGDYCPVCNKLNYMTQDVNPFYNHKVFSINRKNLGIDCDRSSKSRFEDHVKEHLRYTSQQTKIESIERLIKDSVNLYVIYCMNI
ncbi:uncharacterized protein LOC128961583 [Oppia nitens]|uniref:uncharacterized protein LOC128961583 n=1 Tax=Oppia nitens TaxID=1686743 RepID=UPI0023DCCBC9|nr:uncharacterized protein LOC128961583 [Oppia nitens]